MAKNDINNKLQCYNAIYKVKCFRSTKQKQIKTQRFPGVCNHSAGLQFELNFIENVGRNVKQIQNSADSNLIYFLAIISINWPEQKYIHGQTY
jgi:hypothetical protein